VVDSSFLLGTLNQKEELKLSDKQKETLLEKSPEYAQETKKVFDKMFAAVVVATLRWT
jgi:hypothetical protein